MRNRILIVCAALVMLSCKHQSSAPLEKHTDNEELKQMIKKDQEIRSADTQFDFESVDKVHREKVFEMLANGLIRTNQDKLNAALILQHTALGYCDQELRSNSAENYLLAYQLSKSAFDSGYKQAAYYVAITYDRYLLYTQGYQKYGTQRIFDDKTGEELWAPIDSTTSDKQRMIYGVPVKDSLLSKYKMALLKQPKN